MLGHCAQSVGGALPGSGGFQDFVGQVLLPFDGTALIRDIIAPEDGFVFAEIVGRAGDASNGGTSRTASTGGASGADALVKVTKGQLISVSMPERTRSTTAATISVDGVVVASGVGGPSYGSSANTPAGEASPGAGKYPGSSWANNRARGGGRLAGYGGNSFSGTGPSGADNGSAGPGGGARAQGNLQDVYGGLPIACLTFFRSQDGGLAFANSLYGGNWKP